MKKTEKFFNRMEQIENVIIDYCNENSLTYQRNGEYSIFITMKETIKNFINELKDYIISSVNISKKKLKKILTLLIVKDRMYILFKTNLSCY